MNICLKCVVVTCSIPFSHSPVENPVHRRSAASDGCGRPSSQIVRFAFSKSPVSVYAMSRRLIGSMISPMCGLGFGPRIEYDPACGRD